jgi:DNA repair exonuclease SbcCD ATPase subunit
VEPTLLLPLAPQLREVKAEQRRLRAQCQELQLREKQEQQGLLTRQAAMSLAKELKEVRARLARLSKQESHLEVGAMHVERWDGCTLGWFSDSNCVQHASITIKQAWCPLHASQGQCPISTVCAMHSLTAAAQSAYQRVQQPGSSQLWMLVLV